MDLRARTRMIGYAIASGRSSKCCIHSNGPPTSGRCVFTTHPNPPPPPLRRATPLLTSRACPTIFVRLPAGPPQPILTPSAYFAALGKLVESVLSRILTDVEDLDDISEVESTRLAELCRMLQPLEELFVEPSTGVSAVE